MPVDPVKVQPTGFVLNRRSADGGESTDNEIRKAIIQERLKELNGSRKEVTSKYQYANNMQI